MKKIIVLGLGRRDAMNRVSKTKGTDASRLYFNTITIIANNNKIFKT